MTSDLTSAPALASLMEQLARRIHSQGYAADLFPAQWSALRYLASAPPNLRTAIDLARFQGLASGAVARTVRTLVSKGLIAKGGTIGRGRAEQLNLTDAGRALLEEDPLRHIAAALETLCQDDRRALSQGIEIAIKATMSGNETDAATGK
ncbi:MarR family winged helix-turn-helix transcriptional regulator [Consotaella salsifontis]|uniref:DNA-binding transcriptional regulator, MarR family n=1 Tax=Consotaella salsifontis TaxID=1365950 RepID=A0A1T4MM63_9HYPH|nr:MarR family transcriptional regulator [Consotaella salsifontis]SJZ68092.1 DNA-binding transcriptional regulator, MarR family [Consotaella salsifontis]